MYRLEKSGLQTRTDENKGAAGTTTTNTNVDNVQCAKHFKSIHRYLVCTCDFYLLEFDKKIFREYYNITPC